MSRDIHEVYKYNCIQFAQNAKSVFCSGIKHKKCGLMRLVARFNKVKRKEGTEDQAQMPAYITPHENWSYDGMTS